MQDGKIDLCLYIPESLMSDIGQRLDLSNYRDFGYVVQSLT